ncbi:odorant receptor 131-2-like [Pseudophryne corroboree]|uniref:odorant receptor 131-2-like n=1 Tax=Pseudophryne corroboree TaxID=495146 RepID=UPI0030821BFF
MNSTESYNNVTQMSTSNNRTSEIILVVFFVLTMISICFFLYFICIVLIVYFTAPHVRENSRYVLFAHMLINDTMYLSLGLFLALAHQLFFIPVPLCYFILSITTATFRVTPYNLAVMSLERYLAICYPLQYPMLCTVQRSYSVISVMWIVGLLPNVADVIVLSISVKKDFYSQRLLCKQEKFLVQPVQTTIRSVTFLGSLIMVALVILITYIKVMMVARKTGSGQSSATKAGRTVMLHAFQLLLCVVSLTSIITESYGGMYMVLFNFLVFMCLPRLLSPLIYGIRDEVFRKCIRNIYSTIYTKMCSPKLKA